MFHSWKIHWSSYPHFRNTPPAIFQVDRTYSPVYNPNQQHPPEFNTKGVQLRKRREGPHQNRDWEKLHIRPPLRYPRKCKCSSESRLRKFQTNVLIGVMHRINKRGTAL